MTDTLRYEIVSPERLLKDAQAAMVVVPGADGDFAVLPQHAPMMSTIRPGVIEVYEDDTGSPEKLFLKGGLAQVSPDGLTILAEEAFSLSELDAAEVDANLVKARAAVDAAEDDVARVAAEKEVAWMVALQEVLAA